MVSPLLNPRAPALVVSESLKPATCRNQGDVDTVNIKKN